MALLGLVPEIKDNVTLRMTPQEANREAVGKALSLLGTTISITGAVMALSVNPAMKQQASGVYAKLPKQVQDNKVAVLIGVGLLGAAAAYWWIKQGVAKQNSQRYGV